MASTHILRIACPDARGLVARVSTRLFQAGVNIVENAEYVDPDRARFFMRTEFTGEVDAEALRAGVTADLPAGAEISLAAARRKRLVLLATREAHCLGDLLIRCAHGELDADVAGVVANHDTLRGLTEGFRVPFHLVSHEGLERADHEARVSAAVEALGGDLVVLAKYMRVLSPALVGRFAGRLVNIHHSFLPAFIGANPYRQAYERGVKIIGATAHFVTDQLDEGPIITQDVVPVRHHDRPADMALAGRDVEKIVLARALRLLVEDRVFLDGNRTVVFD
jgi:formyltetrahydrofolate deformylase